MIRALIVIVVLCIALHMLGFPLLANLLSLVAFVLAMGVLLLGGFVMYICWRAMR